MIYNNKFISYVYNIFSGMQKQDEINCINIIKQYKRMINYDDVTKENINKHNLWWQIPNIMKKQQEDDYGINDKIYLYLKDANKAKYQHLLKNCEHNDSKIIEKIEKLLLNFLIICRMSIKRLNSITKAKNFIYW